MDKKIFIEVLTTLRRIEDRRDFMESEIGMDMTAYEDQFFHVIENLFKLAFSSSNFSSCSFVSCGGLILEVSLTAPKLRRIWF